MVLRCAWGICNSDVRYPDRLNGAKLIPFPKPKTNYEKCLRWIKACGRPHFQLNIRNINKHKAVCSKHFVGGQGPSENFPDPIHADGTPPKGIRSGARERSLTYVDKENYDPVAVPFTQAKIAKIGSTTDDVGENETVEDPTTTGTQTDDKWVCPLDILALTAENRRLKCNLEQKERTITWLRTQLKKKEKQIMSLQKENLTLPQFSIEDVMKKESKSKGLFQYYTGITHVRFCALFTFLIPPDFKLSFGTGRTDLQRLSYKNGLFLTLCRMRHDFGLKDMSVRFGLKMQSVSVLFNTWVNHMYFKLGQISIWPHRDLIIKNMPKKFKKDFPNTLAIIDGTEFKTQVPTALSLQSQMYSDYKSSTTLKALIGCDPNGSVIFVSELFTGSVSDKVLTSQSGFYGVLKELMNNGYININDSIMADKGFTISEELRELGLSLNIPPFSTSGSQFSQADIAKTQKIARHRIHIERLIRKVKTYKILSNIIPTALFSHINQVWSVCCYLTLFQDVFVKDT